MPPLHSPVPVKIEENDLVSLLKSQDRKAFSYLYDNYSGALLGVIVKVIGEGERARDVLQEVFVKIWKHVGGYDETKGTLYTWMFKVARNSAIDCLRSSDFKNDVRTMELVPDATKHQRTTISVEHIGLKQIVTKLKKELSAIIELSYFRGFTHEEVAKVLQIPIGTVKTRTRSAIMEMRHAMAIGV